MKTIKKKKEVKRVSDAQAETLTKQGWKYVPKSEWRKVRDARNTSKGKPTKGGKCICGSEKKKVTKKKAKKNGG